MNIDEPKISIVLPTYNGSKYILEALESIRDQRMTDYECIVVDDASTDNTFDIVSDFIKNDYRFKLIRNEINKQLPETLNVGFREAVGSYLTWTSDDNRYLKDAIGDMYEYLNNNIQIMMVCANMINVDEEGRFLSEQEKYNAKNMAIGNTVGACFMYRREVLETIGEYDVNLFGVEDYDYWLRILKHYGKIGHLDKYLYVYRIHDKSLTATKAEKIKKKHSYLLSRDFEWILNNVKDNKETLYRLYSRLIETDTITQDEKNKIGFYLPEIRIIEEFNIDKRLILYGAGQVCNKALNEIPHDRIAYIADKLPARYGGWKDNIPILSLEEVVEIQYDYNVLITVGNKLVYEVMRDLVNAGIKSYCPYELYKKMKGIEWC